MSRCHCAADAEALTGVRSGLEVIVDGGMGELKREGTLAYQSGRIVDGILLEYMAALCTGGG